MNKSVVLLIILISFIAGCNEQKFDNILISSDCEKNAQALVPDYVYLETSMGVISLASLNNPNYGDNLDHSFMANTNVILFKDNQSSQQMTYAMGIPCKIGNKKGENVNYCYTPGITYSKQVTDNAGNILGENTFKASLIVDYANRKEIPEYSGVIIKHYEVKVIKSIITDCHWTE